MGVFEGFLYIGMLEGSSKFFTEARKMGIEIKMFLFTSSSVSGFMMGLKVSFFLLVL